MIRFLAIALLVVTANAVPVEKTGDRIIGGKPIPIEEIPYQISIRSHGRHSCGGSIISNKYILTAAHCVFDTNITNCSIKAGSANRQLGGSVYKVVNIIRHDYKMNSDFMPMNDIALLEVNPPFKFGETCAPISLFQLKEEAIPGSIALVSGWGRTRNNSRPIYVEAVEVPMISKEECRKAYKNLPDGEICAMHSLGGKDSCQGDSGGPLVIDGRLAGIISWGFGCGIKQKPGVYTEVAYYIDWINKNAGFD